MRLAKIVSHNCPPVVIEVQLNFMPNMSGKEALVVTRFWQKWRFSAPQTQLWLIKVWFSASTFVVKIANFL